LHIQEKSGVLQHRWKLAEVEAMALQAATDTLMSDLEHSEADPQSDEHLHIMDDVTDVTFQEDDDWVDQDDYVGPKVVP
jgi:hypothetical protein